MRQLPPASAGVEPTNRVSWSHTSHPHQLESNPRPASAGVTPATRIGWSRTHNPRQLESQHKLYQLESNGTPALAGIDLLTRRLACGLSSHTRWPAHMAGRCVAALSATSVAATLAAAAAVAAAMAMAMTVAVAVAMAVAMAVMLRGVAVHRARCLQWSTDSRPLLLRRR